MLTIHKSVTEDELLTGCKKKQPLAQRALYNRIAPKMLGVCFRYINDREEAEHVMIGGMVKVFDKVDQFNSEGSFEGWIRRIMVNESLMYLRRNRALSLEVEIDATDREPNFGRLENHLEAEDLIDMIQTLPIGYRTVFNLYAIEGYSHKEIAETLEISENTSKSQLSRARKFLQNRLVSLDRFAEKQSMSHGTI